MPKATPCQLPSESRLRDSLPRMDYQDSFEVPSRTPDEDVVVIYAAALGHLPIGFQASPRREVLSGETARHRRRVLRRLGPANRH